jgi:hypothetical protein
MKDSHVNTSADVSKFKILLFHAWMLNSAWAGARGRGRWLALSSTVHEQAQSNRACNIFNFVVLGFLQGFCICLSLCFIR